MKRDRLKWTVALVAAALVVSWAFMVALAGCAPQDDLDLPVWPRATPPPIDATRQLGPQQLSPVEPPPPEKDPRDEPPPVFFGEEIDVEGGAIVFVIDRSGSMDEPLRPVERGIGVDGQPVLLGPDSPTRLEAAQRELVRCLSSLAPNLRFNVWAFDCTVTSWAYDLRAADAAGKASAIAWVEALRGGSSTGTGPAVARALAAHRECVSYVLLTDGAPNCTGGNNYTADPPEHRRMIRDANAQGAAITVFGIAASGSYRAFCQQVAADSGGAYFDVQ